LNIRRIFILFLYLVVVTVLAKLYDLWTNAFNPDYDAQRAGSIILAFVLCIVGIALLYSAIYQKKLSHES